MKLSRDRSLCILKWLLAALVLYVVLYKLTGKRYIFFDEYYRFIPTYNDEQLSFLREMPSICTKGCVEGMIDANTINLTKYAQAGECAKEIVYVDKQNKQHLFKLVNASCCTQLGTCAIKTGARCCTYKRV